MNLVHAIEDKQKKAKITDVKSGDVVRVHQKIKEGEKERVQVFEGLVINTKRTNSLTSSITVRRIASGVGVEKSFLVHSPLITQIEVVKRSKVRRSNLSYMRSRSGKSARLGAVDFDKDEVNVPADFKGSMPEPEEVAEKTEEVSEVKPEADKVDPKAEDKSEKKTDAPAEAESKEEAKADDSKSEDKTADKAESKEA